MSAEKPEIGDVWIDNRNSNFKILIYKSLQCKYDVEVLTSCNSMAMSIKQIKKDFSYLGKSKASIEDLFEVE